MFLSFHWPFSPSRWRQTWNLNAGYLTRHQPIGANYLDKGNRCEEVVNSDDTLWLRFCAAGFRCNSYWLTTTISCLVLLGNRVLSRPKFALLPIRKTLPLRQQDACCALIFHPSKTELSCCNFARCCKSLCLEAIDFPFQMFRWRRNNVSFLLHLCCDVTVFDWKKRLENVNICLLLRNQWMISIDVTFKAVWVLWMDLSRPSCDLT